MSRKTLSAIQIASTAVPLLTKRWPMKRRMLAWLVTMILVAMATKMSRQQSTAR